MLLRITTIRQVMVNLMWLLASTILVVRACLLMVVMIFPARTSTKTVVA